jgi:RNA polymerase subunit RPABC4/transcription elongation factor Spt4
MSFSVVTNVLVVLALQGVDPFQIMSDILSSTALRAVIVSLLLLLAVLWLALVYWTYADASRRGSWKFMWGVIAFLFPFVGTLVYLIVRPPEYLLDHRERELELAVLERELREQVSQCPNCRNIVEKDFLMCPECGWELKRPCENCNRPLSLRWSVCPYCETEQEAASQKER